MTLFLNLFANVCYKQNESVISNNNKPPTVLSVKVWSRLATMLQYKSSTRSPKGSDGNTTVPQTLSGCGRSIRRFCLPLNYRPLASHAQVVGACEQFAMVSIAKKSTLGPNCSHAGIGLNASTFMLYQFSISARTRICMSRCCKAFWPFDYVVLNSNELADWTENVP